MPPENRYDIKTPGVSKRIFLFNAIQNVAMLHFHCLYGVKVSKGPIYRIIEYSI